MNKDEALSALPANFSNLNITPPPPVNLSGGGMSYKEKLEVGLAAEEPPAPAPHRISAAAAAAEAPRGLVRHVTNVHRDDIHGMVHIHDRLITGSKDTSVKMWRDTGDRQCTLFEHPQTTPTSYSYKHWITALDTFSDGSIVVGTRNGYVTCRNIYSNTNYYSGILENHWNKSTHKNLKHAAYKQRNEPRITSIMCQTGDTYLALIGMPEKFIQLDLDTNKIRRFFQFDSPDWVYGFSQLTREKIAVIHACTLSVLQESTPSIAENGWTKIATLVDEGPRIKQQRPFISDINRFEAHPAHLALAFFGGITRVIDIEHDGKIQHETHEHQQRVWKTVPMDAHTYMSCADDGLIKTWDIRQAQSTRTYTGHPGRVSSIARLRNGLFAAASCPESPFDDPDQGQLFFYDQRL